METRDKILGIRYTVFNAIWLACFIAVCVLILCSVLSYGLSIIFFGALLLTSIISLILSAKSPFKAWNSAAWASTFCAFIGLLLAIFCL